MGVALQTKDHTNEGVFGNLIKKMKAL